MLKEKLGKMSRTLLHATKKFCGLCRKFYAIEIYNIITRLCDTFFHFYCSECPNWFHTNKVICDINKNFLSVISTQKLVIIFRHRCHCQFFLKFVDRNEAGILGCEIFNCFKIKTYFNVNNFGNCLQIFS